MKELIIDTTESIDVGKTLPEKENIDQSLNLLGFFEEIKKNISKVLEHDSDIIINKFELIILEALRNSVNSESDRVRIKIIFNSKTNEFTIVIGDNGRGICDGKMNDINGLGGAGVFLKILGLMTKNRVKLYRNKKGAVLVLKQNIDDLLNFLKNKDGNRDFLKILKEGELNILDKILTSSLKDLEKIKPLEQLNSTIKYLEKETITKKEEVILKYKKKGV